MFLNTTDKYLADPIYETLKAKVIELTGLVYYVGKDNDFCAHLDKRMLATSTKNCADYLYLIQDGPRGKVELDYFIMELTIGETYFFRHREQFDALRDHVIPEIIARKEKNFAPKTLRIWSAGCSIGAEPYSVALMLREHFQTALEGWQVNIWATDINRAFLKRAREGVFDDWAFRSNPESMRLKHFKPLGKQWVIEPEAQKMVTFEYENLVRGAKSGEWLKNEEFDLIICRNVMIYFDSAILSNLIPLFFTSIKPEGWLMVGHAEQSIESYAQFEVKSFSGAILYRKSPGQKVSSPFDAPIFKNPVAQNLFVPLEKLPTASFPPLVKPSLTADSIKSMADKGDIRGALEACTKYLKSDTLNPVVFFYQGLLQHQKGSLLEAESAMLSCIYLNSKFTLAHFYLGLIQKGLGNAGSSKAFRNALDLARSLSDSATVEHGDGLTVRELKHLAKIELGEA